MRNRGRGRGSAGRGLVGVGTDAVAPVSAAVFVASVMRLHMSGMVQGGTAGDFAATGSITGPFTCIGVGHPGGGIVQLTFDTAFEPGETVTLDYTAGTLVGQGGLPAVASFAAFPVENPA